MATPSEIADVRLKDAEQLLAEPATAPVPEDQLALATTLALAALRVNASNIENAVAYLGRLAPEMGVVFFKLVLARDHTMAHTPAFAAWAVANFQALGASPFWRDKAVSK